MSFNKRHGAENYAPELGARVARKNFAGLPN